MSKHEKSDWSRAIRSLIEKLGLSQKDLAELVGVSAPTVTRWIHGSHEPTPASYMALGNLLGLPDGAYFWERAGVDASDLSSSKLGAALPSLKVDLKDFKIVSARRLSKEILTPKQGMVLVPLVNVNACGDEYRPGPHVSLARAEIVDLFIAPLSWCPHPENALCMKVSGDSMASLISDDSIICVDTAITERKRLDGRLAVFLHQNYGYKVARFLRLPSSDILVSANHKRLPVDVTDPARWKAVGEVIWWLSKDSPPSDQQPARGR